MNCEINEIWKPVEGYEEKYEISNKGLIHSFKRKGAKEKYTYGGVTSKGYLALHLPSIVKKVHNIVWETFIGPIPEGYDIHHINGNKQDNRLENLCLLEHFSHSLLHNQDETHIIQFKPNGEFVAEYKSTMEAERQTNINHSHICQCCNSKRKTAGGFIWKYKEVA